MLCSGITDSFSSCELFSFPLLLRAFGVVLCFFSLDYPELLQDGETKQLFLSLGLLPSQQMSNERVRLLDNSSQKGVGSSWIFHSFHAETLQGATGVAFRLMTALSRKKKQSEKEQDSSIYFLIMYFFRFFLKHLFCICARHVNISRLFIPWLLGRRG